MAGHTHQSPNPTPRSRHLIVPQRTANVSNSPSARMEHEIQMALLRRRAAMTRAVSPNISAREQWLLAGLIDTATHWVKHPVNYSHPYSKPATVPDALLNVRHDYEYCDVSVSRSDHNMLDYNFQVSQRLTSDLTNTPQQCNKERQLCQSS